MVLFCYLTTDNDAVMNTKHTFSRPVILKKKTSLLVRAQCAFCSITIPFIFTKWFLNNSNSQQLLTES